MALAAKKFVLVTRAADEQINEDLKRPASIARYSCQNTRFLPALHHPQLLFSLIPLLFRE
jgi:hypothetical protein